MKKYKQLTNVKIRSALNVSAVVAFRTAVDNLGSVVRRKSFNVVAQARNADQGVRCPKQISRINNARGCRGNSTRTTELQL